MRKKIKGYERYEIDESGRVFNTITNRELHASADNRGYMGIELVGDSGKPRRLLLHRLVAEAFIPNEEGLPIINHKDENPGNNHVSNLEWCTYKYNIHYGTCPERRAKSMEHFYKSEKIKDQAKENGKVVSRPVEQYDRSGKFIARYDSGKDASKATGFSHSHILECCAGKRYKTVGGFVWRYERGNDLLVFQS